MRLSVIVGTRPEIIKMAPIIKKCQDLSIDYYILHTGQHYTYYMDKIFFEQLRIPVPQYNLNVGSGTHGRQTAKIMMGIERILSMENQDCVLVQGDTNTVLAGAVAASKMHIKVGHVEAGLRSYDKTMPEELNRILADHCSSFLFSPTAIATRILKREGLPRGAIFETGNTIVDAVFQNLNLSRDHAKIVDDLSLEKGKYFLVTLHRQENVDNIERLFQIIKGLNLIRDKFEIPIVLPIHPRSKKMLRRFNIKCTNLKLISPLDYFSFLNLEKSCGLILTDSGGVQEEACILRVPCVTIRNSTERMEAVKVGANVIAGTHPKRLLHSVEVMLRRSRKWENPFGDGRSANRIIEILQKNL